MITIEKAEDVVIDERDFTCETHGSHPTHFLRIGDVLTPLCETCVDELRDELEKL